jgi:pyrimidine-nucleoside phosphorylase
VHRAPVQHSLGAKTSGRVTAFDAELIGRASVLLGGGRQKAGDSVDFAVGFSAIKKTGEQIEAGEPLLRIHARDEQSLASVLPIVEKAAQIS